MAWNDVRVTPPPFGERVLVMLCDSISLYAGKTSPDTSIHTMTIFRRSYKDDRCSATEYEKYEAGGFKDFNKYQFDMLTHECLPSKKTSDRIIFWAKYPDHLEEVFLSGPLMEFPIMNDSQQELSRMQDDIKNLESRISDLESKTSSESLGQLINEAIGHAVPEAYTPVGHCYLNNTCWQVKKIKCFTTGDAKCK